MRALTQTELDALTRQFTACNTFAEFTDTLGTDYFPTLTAKGTEPLADAYDAAMAARGDTRRAWRGSKRTVRAL